MNRSILIVICDFLLLSLLAFSNVDINRIRNPADTERTASLQLQTNQARGDKDLAAVMRQALNEQQKGREALLQELAKAQQTATNNQALLAKAEQEANRNQALLAQAREEASQKQALLTQAEKEASQKQALLVEARREASQREALLVERERLVETLKQGLDTQNAQAQQLQEQRGYLEHQYVASQQRLDALNEKLHQANIQDVISKEKLSAMKDEVQRQVATTANLQRQISYLADSNAVVQAQKEQLTGKLLVAETQTQAATQQVAQMQTEVQTQRKEKAQLIQHAEQLAQGVKTLATNSGELAKEIHQNTPLVPNTIFSDFLSNRVEAAFHAVRNGFLGSDKRRTTETILVTDGTRTFALCHVQDTPLAFSSPGRDWDGLTGMLEGKTHAVPIRSVSFAWPDPRVVLIPVTKQEAQELGCKVYTISSDPFRFQQAVLVGARESYYGECQFQMDTSTPGYLKLDRSFIKGLFGKFNPSRGDLVFSEHGELLGVMVNGAYCRMIHSFDVSATIHFGEDVAGEQTGQTLSRLFAQATGMPAKLQ